jgi:hypothetical protein
MVTVPGRHGAGGVRDSLARDVKGERVTGVVREEAAGEGRATGAGGLEASHRGEYRHGTAGLVKGAREGLGPGDTLARPMKTG